MSTGQENSHSPLWVQFSPRTASVIRDPLTKPPSGQALDVFWKTSLFGDFESFNARPPRVRSHVFSGTANHWQKKMPKAVGKIYAQEFGDALIELGYETDSTWVEQLPVDPVPFNLPDPMDDPSAPNDAADAQLSR